MTEKLRLESKKLRSFCLLDYMIWGDGLQSTRLQGKTRAIPEACQAVAGAAEEPARMCLYNEP